MEGKKGTDEGCGEKVARVCRDGKRGAGMYSKGIREGKEKKGSAYLL